jgi:hypothetical protein
MSALRRKKEEWRWAALYIGHRALDWIHLKQQQQPSKKGRRFWERSDGPTNLLAAVGPPPTLKKLTGWLLLLLVRTIACSYRPSITGSVFWFGLVHLVPSFPAFSLTPDRVRDNKLEVWDWLTGGWGGRKRVRERYIKRKQRHHSAHWSLSNWVLCFFSLSLCHVHPISIEFYPPRRNNDSLTCSVRPAPEF